MKTYFYFLIFIFISFSVANAQKPLSIPEAKPEVVKANWIKTIEKGTKSKVQKVNNEMTLFGAILSDFAGGSVNIMSEVENYDSLTRLFVSVETARDVFVEENSEEYDKVSAFLKKFGKDQYTIVAKEQLSAEESTLKKLEKEFSSSRKAKQKLEKGIKSSKVNITQQNDKIKNINKELDILDIKINNSSTLLSTMDDGDEAKKSKKSELKSLQKKKKSLLKDINTAESRISKANTLIDDNTKEITLNDSTQEDLYDQVTQQKLTVDYYTKKLKTIGSY